MNTLLVIMAHREAQETFDRHLPLWEAHKCPLLVYCPTDSQIHYPRGCTAVCYGNASHHDAMANRRFKNLISFIANMGFDAYWIFEYDAICLSAGLPHFFFRGTGHSNDFESPIIGANYFYDDRPDRGFIGTLFTHPPLYLNKAGVRALDAQLKRLQDDCEQGFWDRMVGLAIQNDMGIAVVDFLKRGLGYAENTIQYPQQAIRAVENGAIFIHGIKNSPGLLHDLIGAHEYAKANGKLRHGLEIPL